MEFRVKIDGEHVGERIVGGQLKDALAHFENQHSRFVQNYMYATVYAGNQLIIGYRWSKNDKNNFKRWTLAFYYNAITDSLDDLNNNPFDIANVIT